MTTNNYTKEMASSAIRGTATGVARVFGTAGGGILAMAGSATFVACTALGSVGFIPVVTFGLFNPPAAADYVKGTWKVAAITWGTAAAGGVLGVVGTGVAKASAGTKQEPQVLSTIEKVEA